MKSANLPPDAPLLALAKIVNARLAALGAMVNFYRIVRPESHATDTGIVYSCGVRRAVVTTPNMLTEHDADNIVQSVTEWIESIKPQSKWTTDPGEAA